MHLSRLVNIFFFFSFFSFYKSAAITDANIDPIKMLMDPMPIPDIWLAAPWYVLS